MVDVIPSEVAQPTVTGWLPTEHEIQLSSTISLIAQPLLFVVFVVTYNKARAALLQRSASAGSLQRGSLIHLTALVAMLFLAMANVLMSVLDSRAIPAYAGKLDTTHLKTFDDKYFLFLSVRGVQFYLFMVQTMVANMLMIYMFYAKSDGYPKAGSHAITHSILGNIFGLCAFANTLWALEFLYFSAAVNLLTSVPLMWASLRSPDTVWGPRSAVNYLFSRKFFDAMIESAALYRVASFSLLVTFHFEPNVLFYPNISILSPLMGIAFSLAAMSKYRDSPDSDGAIQLTEEQLAEMEAALPAQLVVDKEEATEVCQ